MIRKATVADLDAVEQGYIELLTHEKENGGHSNWVLGVYPTRATAEKALAEGALYVLTEDGALCASMILNQHQPEEYAAIDWLYPARAEEVLVIHTLCVSPLKAGRGFGKRMAQYALEQAAVGGFSAIRLDTFAGNAPAAALYRKLGFRYAGLAQVLLEGVIPEEQIFFEKKIEGAAPPAL